MFLSLFASGPDRSPYGDFWFEPVGSRSATGARVSADSALRLTAVWACVRILSETLASMPFVMYRPLLDGGREIVTDHPIVRLFDKAPNAMQTPFEWREMMQAHLVLRGNAYNQILTDRAGVIVALQPMHPDRVKIEMLAAGEYRYRFLQPDGSDLVLSRGEVWHVRGMSFDGILGLNPIELARDAVGMGLSAQDYGARFFQNDAKPGGVIEFQGQFKDQTARQTFISAWQAAQGGANRGKTVVLERDMKYVEVGLNNSDAQFIESRKFQVTEIARMFRVPPHMIADLDRSTNNNIEHQGLEFVLHTMTPWAERWESSIETNLLTEADSDLEIEFDFSSLLRGDHAARSTYLNSGIMTGWLTRNEARIIEGYDPLPDLDEPLQPLNMVPAGTPPQLPGAKVPGAPDARRAALVHGISARLAHRAAGALQKEPASEVFNQAFSVLVADALAVPTSAGAEFCAWARESVGVGTAANIETMLSAKLRSLDNQPE